MITHVITTECHTDINLQVRNSSRLLVCSRAHTHTHTDRINEEDINVQNKSRYILSFMIHTFEFFTLSDIKTKTSFSLSLTHSSHRLSSLIHLFKFSIDSHSYHVNDMRIHIIKEPI